MKPKSIEDFNKYMDSFFKAELLPDGNHISAANIANHFDNLNIRFIGKHKQIASRRTLETWYREWGEKNKGFNSHDIKKKVRLTSQPINSNIDILSESTVDELDYPEGESEVEETYVWNVKYKKILWISDLHIPYHNLSAIKTAINYGREKGVNGIIIGGDMLDMYNASFHERTPNKTRLVRELEMGREFFSQLRKIFPSEKIVFKEGNHEQRLERYLFKNAPDIADLDALHLNELLRMKEFKIDYVKNNQLINVGKLSILHGNEFKTGSGGVYVARGLRLKAFDNILFGNFHKTQSDFQKDVNGRLYGGWSVGCLCDLSPKYMPFNQWNLGFAVIELMDSGNFSVENKKIIDGAVL